MSDIQDTMRNTKAVLLDFDGPVCSVFAGYPAPIVAGHMREALSAYEHAHLGGVSDTQDPLNLLRWTAEHRPGLIAQVDDFLSAAERKAVLSAAPTPRAHDVIVAATRAGRLVAIVSNNSEDAIRDYLAIHRLESYVSWVAGRPYAAPHRMKPDPDSLRRTADALNVDPAACVFIGDSVTDVQASRLAGVKFIGYAKRADRGPVLFGAGAEIVVGSMGLIANVLEGGGL